MSDVSSGGRHENEHVDFLQISILSTADELACSDRLFSRTVAYLEGRFDDDLQCLGSNKTASLVVDLTPRPQNLPDLKQPSR